MNRRTAIVTLASGLAVNGTALGGQQPAPVLQLADRGPTFYYQPAPGAPVEDGRNVPVLRRHISVDFVDVRVADALDAIGRRAGLSFAYSADVAPLTGRVTLQADHMTVAAALTDVLDGTGLDVRLSPQGLATLMVHGAAVQTVRQQGRGTIAGRVTDATTHGPLDQVAVRIEGPALGAVAGNDGRYTVRDVPSGTYRVTARRVGYTPLGKTVTVVADSVATVDFVLAAAATKLNEVVTTAVGDQRRYEVGNVISTINADSIAPTAPITSLTDLISARAPGVQVEETSGMTGAGETIRIRGQSSLVLQSDPIVIIDGVRQDNTQGGVIAPIGTFTSGPASVVPAPSRLNDLDFSEIATIDVLKGPAASTEYGTDAANGVIVITTKHGTTGKPVWTASAEQTTSSIPESFPALYHSWGHTTNPSHSPVQCPLVPFAFASGYGSTAGTCAVDSVTTWDPLNHPFYSMFGTGARGKYDLSVSGGSSAVRYFVAGGLSNETGVLQMPGIFRVQAATLGLPHSVFHPNSEGQRSVRATTAMTLGPTADLSVSGAYLSTDQQVPNATFLYQGVFGALAIPDSTDSYGYGSGSDIPIYQLSLPTEQNTSRLTGGMTMNWRPAPWLVTRGTVGVDHGSQRLQAAILPQVAPLNPFFPAQLGVGTTTTDIYTVDVRASATAALTRVVRAVTSVGLQLADTRAQGTSVTATGVTATNLTLNGAVNPAVTQLGSRQATLGGYGEEELGLANRLFLTGALRIDAGSGFGHAYSTAAYPKASLSWLALGDGPTTIRVRGAFGESGVQPPNGAALQLYAPNVAWYHGAPANSVTIIDAENPNLQPERSAEYEGGIDVGLWQNRMSVELTGYSKTTHNALVSTGTGWELGGYAYEENVGEIRNVGAEAAVTATLVRAHTFTWDVSLNASVNHNKLISLAPGILSQQFAAGVGAVYRFAPGYPLYGYWAPRVQYADLNHDGSIEPTEITVADSLSYVGTSAPTREASLGMHVGLARGALTVGALGDYRGGARLMNATSLLQAFTQIDQASNDRNALLWQQARDVGALAVETTGLDGRAPVNGFYEDATYVRFRELSVTYAIPRSVMHVLRVHALSVTGAVRNLALWTRYGGADPEVSGTQGTNAVFQPTSNTSVVNRDIREDVASVPLLRYWVVRLNAGF